MNPRILTVGLTLLLLSPLTLAGQWSWPAVDGPSSVTLDLALNHAALTPGKTLTVRAAVNNQGGGPLADFVFAILLPDGSTLVSAGPGVGARFGRMGDLRTLVPVAQGISLAGAFQYRNDAFFSYTFNGSEPTGTYRVYFASLRSGALNDGAVGGPELLALQTAEFTVSPPLTTTVDPSRTATATIPPSGGSVSTTAANGTGYQLTVSEGALRTAKSVSITPITSAANIPGNGTLALGLRAEPSGLLFATPVTLTVTLPPGRAPNPSGYSALVSSDGGREIQRVQVRLTGATLTVTVPHFSDFVVVESALWFCARPQSPVTGRACELLVAALAEFGDINAPGFGAVAESVLDSWFKGSLKDRVDAAQVEPPPAGADEALDALFTEVNDWTSLYTLMFESIVIGTPGRPLGSVVDYLYAGLKQATLLAQRRANARCLADKPNAIAHIKRVVDLEFKPVIAFFVDRLDFEAGVCLDLSIDAAPPPVLTPDQPAPIPMAIVAKFSDGVERRSRILLTMTATNATMAPAGGETTTPVFDPAIIMPSATGSIVTITAAFAEPVLDDLPERSRSFPAGATTIPAIASASLYVKSDAILPDFGAPIEPFVEDSSTGPAPQQSVSAVLVRRRAPEGASGWTYDAMARSSATRSLSASGDVLTVAGTGSRSADLTVSGGPPLRRIPSATVGAAGGFVDAVCLDLSRPSLAAYNLTSNGPAKHPGFGNDLIFLTIADHPPVAAPGNGTAGGTRTLAAGRQCFGLFVHSWVCTIGNGTSVECTMPRTLEWSYTVTVRPAP